MSNQISYGTDMKKPNNWKPMKISFDDVDTYDFTKNFFEYVLKSNFIHLYFDFDELKDETEMKEVVDYLDSLKPIFGEYSLGGYTQDITIAETYDIALIEDAHHFISIHAVYYTTMIDSAELVDIMSYTKAKGFYKYTVNKHVDYNVYKIKTRQLFRHVLSNKYYGPNDEKNTITAGHISNDLPPSTQIIQVRGNEKLIERDEWLKVFPQIISTTTQRKVAHEKQIMKKIEKATSIFTIDDINYEDTLIEMTAAELLDIMNQFDNSFDVLNSEFINILHSPFDKEFLRDCLKQWYNSREHANGDDCIDEYIDKYYKHESSNKWFYSLIKHLPSELAAELKDKYKPIDESIDINNSSWSFETINNKTYDISGTYKLINDLKGVVGFTTGDRWFIKLAKDNQFYIDECSDDRLFRKVRYSKPFKSNTKITLEHIIKKYSNYFKYNDAKISPTNKPKIINLFQGLKYKPLKRTGDYRIIQPFLNHIKHIVCNDDDKKYDYYMKWWANILQHITVKNGTLPIIHGAQGSGKSFPSEVFCELFGIYACKNLDDMDKCFGKFNGLLTRYLVCVINEPPNADDKFKYLGKIKARLTQTETIQEKKGMDQIEVESWMNYMMTTNNDNPIQEEKGDRRLIYYPTNNSKCGDEIYFDKLCKSIQPIKQGEYNEFFMRVLLTYMLNEIDTTNWNGETLIREINSNTQTIYNEQLERQYMDLNAVERYVVDNYEKFNEPEGMSLDYISIDGYKKIGISRKLTPICNRICVDTDSHKYNYKLKSKSEIPDLYSIIEYKNYKPPEPTNEEVISEPEIIDEAGEFM